jgi:hypothetical protein
MGRGAGGGLLFSQVLYHFIIEIKILAAVLQNVNGYACH